MKDLPQTPYKGLIPYSEEDAPFFFGREKERKIITANLISSRLTLLYGATGIGKSSVLRAGVAYHLRNLADEEIKKLRQPEFIVVVFNSWRDNPLTELVKSIRDSIKHTFQSQTAQQVVTSSGRLLHPSADEILSRMPETDSLVDILDYWTKPEASDLLIILDQFEEYFVYHEREDGPGTFACEFPRVIKRPNLRVNFLISIREDALAKLDRFEGRLPNLFENYLRIEHLDRTSGRTAIKAPIHKYNESLPEAEHYSYDEGLVEAVLDQVKTGKVDLGQAGVGAIGKDRSSQSSDRIETPFLQLVMETLWAEEKSLNSRRLRLRTLDDLGGAGNIVKSYLEKTMSELSPDEHAVAAKVFHYLVTPLGTKIALTIRDLASQARLNEKAVNGLLTQLAERRIMRQVDPPPDRPKESRYEIFHDVLATPIINWRARYLQIKEQAEAESAKEKALKELEDERARIKDLIVQRKRTRGLVLVLAAALLMLLVLWVFAFQQYSSAVKAKAEAERRGNEAQESLNIINDLDRSVPNFKTIMRGHKNAVNSASLSPDTRSVITASADGTARIWDVSDTERGTVRYELKDHKGPVNSAVFSKDGKYALTASDDKTARIWNAETGATIFTLGEHADAVKSAIFSSDATRVATIDGAGTARLWNATDGTLQKELRGHRGVVTKAAFSQDGTRLVTASIDGSARIWDAAGDIVKELSGHRNAINSATFSPDGKLVVTASTDGTAWIWDAATGNVLKKLIKHVGSINYAAFSPDGKFVVTASDDGTARVWDATSGKPLVELKGHRRRVTSAAFSEPDGKKVITASEDKTARVWETQSGKLLAELRGHLSRVNTAEFGPRDDLAVTSSGDGLPSGDTTARIWDISEGSGSLNVTDVSVRIDPAKYTGECPATIRILGKITTAGSSGTVKYRFVRNDREKGDERTLEFSSAGTQDVSTVWKFGGLEYPIVSGSFYIEVLSPNKTTSNIATFEVNCEFTDRLPQPISLEQSVSSGTVLFRWAPPAGAPEGISYKVEITGTKPSYRIIIPSQSTELGRADIPAQALRWRVWAIDPTGREGVKTRWRSFTLR